MRLKAYWLGLVLFVVGGAVGVMGAGYANRHLEAPAAILTCLRAATVSNPAEPCEPCCEPIRFSPPEVVFDVKIAQVEWKDGNQAIGGLGQNSQAIMTRDQANAMFADLQKQGNTEVFAVPTLHTTANQAALIRVGRSIPCGPDAVTTEPTLSGNVVNRAINSTVEYRDVGIQLQVTQIVRPDGMVIMRVIPEISTATQSNVNLGDGVLATAFDIQCVESTGVCKAGETMILRGLIQNAGTGLFGLPPMRKTEVLIFLTPEILGQRKAG